MKITKLLLLSVIVFVLFVAALAKNVIVHKKEKVREKAPEEMVELTDGLAESFVARMTIYLGADEKDKVVLAKDVSGQWVIDNLYGVKAKKEIVANIITSLASLKGEVRAQSKDIFRDFEIADDQGAHVILESGAGKVFKHLVIGLRRPHWGSCFARLQASLQVILAQGDPLTTLNIFNKDSKVDARYFMDLKLLSFADKDVNRIEIINQDRKTFVMTRSAPSAGNEAATWRFDAAGSTGNIDASKINGFLRNLLELYAKEPLDPSLSTYGFDRPFLEIKLKVAEEGKQSQEVDILAGSLLVPQKSYYVKVSPSGTVFTVAQESIQNLNKNSAYFIVEKKAGKNTAGKKK
jgi:hypothetical protein